MPEQLVRMAMARKGDRWTYTADRSVRVLGIHCEGNHAIASYQDSQGLEQLLAELPIAAFNAYAPRIVRPLSAGESISFRFVEHTTLATIAVAYASGSCAECASVDDD